MSFEKFEADPQRPLRVARALFCLSFYLSCAALGFGRAWDSYWHATHVFESFWSPPHLFAYGLMTLSFLLCLLLVSQPRLRIWFGSFVPNQSTLPGWPPSLELIVGGYLVMLAAGSGLDYAWHSTFGLDETAWSFPHSLLAWAWLIILCGYLAGFLNLHQYVRLPAYLSLFLGVIVIGFSAAPMLGPFYHNLSRETTTAVASIAVLRHQLSAQHIYQIYNHWNLNRTHVMAIVLGALWSGIALALFWQLDPRPRVLLTGTLVWSVIASAGDWNSLQWLQQIDPGLRNSLIWLPLPIFPAATTLVALKRLKAPDPWAWCGAGWVFGIGSLLLGPQSRSVWSLSGCLLAGPLTLVGAWLGQHLVLILAHLKRKHVIYFWLAPFAISFVFGIIDLGLRKVVP